jgi:hypothetical protein
MHKILGIGTSVTFIISSLTYLMASKVDLFEKLIPFLESLEQYEVDELFFVGLVFTLAIVILVFFLIYENSILKYQAEVNTLRDLLPICANCKKIRDSEGYWHQVEVYIANQTGTKFSHGICQQCTEILYPELMKINDRFNHQSLQ